MLDFIYEALEIPRGPWSGKRAFIVRQVTRLLLELAVLIALFAMSFLLIYSLWPGEIPAAR